MKRFSLLFVVVGLLFLAPLARAGCVFEECQAFQLRRATLGSYGLLASGHLVSKLGANRIMKRADTCLSVCYIINN